MFRTLGTFVLSRKKLVGVAPNEEICLVVWQTQFSCNAKWAVFSESAPRTNIVGPFFVWCDLSVTKSTGFVTWLSLAYIAKYVTDVLGIRLYGYLFRMRKMASAPYSPMNCGARDHFIHGYFSVRSCRGMV